MSWTFVTCWFNMQGLWQFSTHGISNGTSKPFRTCYVESEDHTFLSVFQGMRLSQKVVVTLRWFCTAFVRYNLRALNLSTSSAGDSYICMNRILFRKHTVIQIPGLGCSTCELLYLPRGFLTSVAYFMPKGCYRCTSPNSVITWEL